MAKITQQYCVELDQQDPLANCRDRFTLAPGKIYLDGNSLGALPVSTPPQILQTVDQEWGVDLIQSWNNAGWFELPVNLGNRIGSMIGAAPGQTVVCDNTSINLFKVLHAALGLTNRKRILACQGDFPTDLYMLEGVANNYSRKVSVDLVENDEDIVSAIDQDVAVVILSHINYKTSAVMDMAAITKKAHDAGAMIIWDLCHSAGAIPVELDRCAVDFAIGCTYKYLNGGPGSPAYLYAANRHHSTMGQPLTGWWSHVNPFEFSHQYSPAPGIKHMLSGTQPILSLQGVGCGLDTFEGVSMDQIRQKSKALCHLFIQLIEQQCADDALEIIGPNDGSARGSHVSIAFAEGFKVVQAMIERNVIGDFRAPNLMRFGFAPLYISFQQVWDAVVVLKECLKQEVWNNDFYRPKDTVT